MVVQITRQHMVAVWGGDMSGIDSAVSGLLAIQQIAIRSEIGIAVAAKQMDAQQLQGDAAVALIEAAAQLTKEAGKGANVDSLA